MRVLCADAAEASLIAGLTDLGHEVDVNAGLTAEALPAEIVGYDVLVVRGTKVSAETIAAGDRLRLIVRAGSGYNTIDVDAASAAGISVTNVPGRNAVAVAELTLGLLLAMDRQIPLASEQLHHGQWDKKRFSVAAGVHGRTLGIIGFGGIGRAVAERAFAFGLHVITLARPSRDALGMSAIERLGIEVVEPHAELIRRSDILTLHVPGSADTRHLIGAEELADLGSTGILINTSRGDVVDEVALLSALNGGLRAGLDVFDDEPTAGKAEWTSLIAAHPNVVATPHIGASTEQAQQAVASGVVDLVGAFGRGESIPLVNEPRRS
ncbi:MAG: NAD(P)-dependent oxidoreductase [Actinomycetes bacterium]